jgi:hypothetical protein
MVRSRALRTVSNHEASAEATMSRSDNVSSEPENALAAQQARTGLHEFDLVAHPELGTRAP